MANIRQLTMPFTVAHELFVLAVRKSYDMVMIKLGFEKHGSQAFPVHCPNPAGRCCEGSNEYLSTTSNHISLKVGCSTWVEDLQKKAVHSRIQQTVTQVN